MITNEPKCISCGKCCMDFTVPLNSDDVIRIDKNYIQCEKNMTCMKRKKYKNHYVCVCLDTNEMKCIIYEDRPLTCKNFEYHSRRCLDKIEYTNFNLK